MANPRKLTISFSLLGLLVLVGCNNPMPVPKQPNSNADFKLIQPELERAPAIPELPENFKSKGDTARVVLEVIVLPSGAVGQVKPISGPSMLHGLAIKWASELVFRPGSLNGQYFHFRMKTVLTWSSSGASYEVRVPKSQKDWN